MTHNTLNVPELLKENHLAPRKSLGQNFLIDPGALEKVVSAAEIQATDEVLEIGAGLGSLTRYLSKAAQRVVAVELDKNFMPILAESFQDDATVKLVQGDILKLNPSELVQKDGYLVIANIPYYITSAIIRHLLASSVKPKRMVLTIQKEVARRICSQPGDLSLLALSVQVFGQPTIKATLPAGAFYPPPKVDSAIIVIDLYEKPLIPVEHLETFFKLAKAGFSQKRKMLRKSLASVLNIPTEQIEPFLSSCKIEPTRRAETLSLPEWKYLTAQYIVEKAS